RLPSQGVHLFWWTPHASEHPKAKGAGKFALTPLASRVAIDNTDPEARFLDKTVMLGPALTVVCARRRRSNELRA
ncbi:hypothetical protein, partial [Bradyrhizobium sp. LA2.1]|uniref:hypothetical protein n=1 Tax=Bradyrhizobium sp. LA2.1 TaxID=3156376 RepID=UPI003395097D